MDVARTRGATEPARAPDAAVSSAALLMLCLAAPWLRALAGVAAPATARRAAASLAVALGALTLVVGVGQRPAEAATRVVDAPAHGDVLDPVVLTPDGGRVLFLADLAVDHKVELWSVPSSGGASPRRVTPDLGPDGDVIAFALTPDGQSVVYLADQRVDGIVELFRTPIGGGTSAPLHPPLPAGANVLRFGLTPDGDRAVWIADTDVDATYELYSARLAGGTPARLTPDLPAWADVAFEFWLTGDSQRALYRADVGDDGAYDLFSVRLDGSEEPWRLSADVISESGVAPDLVTNADASVVSFRMEVERGVFHRFAVPVDGTTDAARVHGPPADGATGATPVAALSTDGRGIVFAAELDGPGVAGLWLAPANGTAEPRRISGTIAEGGAVLEVVLTSDDLVAVYRAEQRAAGVAELFAAPLDEIAGARRVSRSLASGGDVHAGFVVLPGDDQVVYRADARRNGQDELFVSSLGPGAHSRVLNPDLPDDGDVRSTDDASVPAFHVAWDASEVLFLADARSDDDLDLYAVPLDGSGPAVLLNDHVDGRSVEDVTAMVASRVGFVSVDSATSSDEDVFVAALRSPPAPANPQAVFGPTAATVSWDAPITDVPIGGYVITAQPGGLTTVVEGDATQAVVDGLDPGVSYVFTVRAVNDRGASDGVDTAAGRLAAPPAAVVDMTAEPGPLEVTVRWTPAATGERVAGWTLRTDTGDDVLELPASVTQVTVRGLDPDVEHTFLLTATNAAGVSPTAAYGPVRPLHADGSAPAAPPSGPPAFRVLEDGHRDALTNREVDRLSGSSRHATAAALSRAAHPGGADVVYLATGRNFPDALAAGPVAAGAAAPILLTDTDRLPAPTVEELQRLAPSEVRVLGGTGAVAATVVTALGALVPDARVTRVAGPNRHATAAVLSRGAFAPGVAEVWVATGRNFPDALAAGAVAGRRGAPILLVDRDRLPDETAAELRRLAPARVRVLGGPGAVSDGVVAAIRSVVGQAIDVSRVRGEHRYATGAAVVRDAFGDGTVRAFLAVGTNFPDALAAGPYAAATGAPILLTARDALPAATRAELQRLQPAQVTILGGTGAISADVLREVAALVGVG